MLIQDLLKGTRLIEDERGRVLTQSIHNMTLAFLTLEDPAHSFDERFGNPLEALKAGNPHGYGTLRVTNPTPLDVIAPPLVVLSKGYAAQNHALPKAIALPARASIEYTDAGCVEGSQTGYLREDGSNELRFFPFAVRESLTLKIGDKSGYSRLYPVVNELGARTGTITLNYLDKFFKAHDETAFEYIAHFERPAQCIGVVIFMGDEIFGVERFPSFRYCAQIWDTLIRDVYASLVIEAIRKHEPALNPFSELTPEELEFSLAQVFETVSNRISERVRARLFELLEVDFSAQQEAGNGGFRSSKLTSEGYVGQVIEAGGVNHFVSLVRRGSFDPAAQRTRFEEVSAYRKASGEQRAFRL